MHRAARTTVLHSIRRGAAAACAALLATAAPASSDPGEDAATRLTIADAEGERSVPIASGATVTIAEAPGGGAPNVQVAANPEDWIVELRGAPLARASARARAADARGALAGRRQRAANAVHQLTAGVHRGIARGAVIRREYDVAFNGFAARIPKELVERVRALPDVAAVHPDVDLHVMLAESVAKVRAPEAWSALGHRGAGTTIAIVDTGVDHSHADLGGCFGGACKVIGGYDFLNGDAAPNDDNGHGTHVAATAAGAGPVPGVAPDARIYAYKACSSSGICPTSTVLAALDRAIDPDDDGDTSDRADVINLSLGGPGNPDDPLAQAVDAATAAGAVVVAAAGNFNGYFQVGSPASARTAVTVGAVDDADAIALFSSGGPSKNILGIKPEIVAPGVAVCAARASGTTAGATCTDTTHVTLQGTSMASPHVSGAAALLVGSHPDATPAQIKSLLVNNAVDLGRDPFVQGAGRLDVVAAADASTTIDPATIGFGLDDKTLPTFIASQTLTLHNHGGSAESYVIDAIGLPSGAVVTATPSSLALAPGESATVEIELTVDNAVVPDRTTAPYAYWGALRVVSGGQTQRVPIAFLKGNVLRMHFDVAPDYVIVHNRLGLYSVPNVGGTTVHVFVPNGTWDLLARFEDPQPGEPAIAWVFREGLAVSGTGDVTVSVTEAVHTLDLLMRDKNDLPVLPTGRTTRFKHRASNLVIAAATMNATPEPVAIRSSAVSPAYDVGFFGFATKVLPEDYAIGANASDGVAGDRHFGNTAAELTPTRLRFAPGAAGAEYERREHCFDGVSYWRCLGGSAGTIFTPLSDLDLYTRTTPGLPFPFWIKRTLQPLGVTWPTGRQTGSLQGGTAPLTLDVLQPFNHVTPFYTSANGELPIGLGPIAWFRQFLNDATQVRVTDVLGQRYDAFSDQTGGTTPGPVLWSLSTGAQPVQSGDLEASQGLLTVTPLTAGPYTFTADSPPYLVDGLVGQAHVQADFDLTRFDRNPPYLVGVQLRSGTTLVDRLTQGAGGGVLEVKVRDLGGAPSSVSVTYGSPPIAAPVSLVAPDTYRATIADCTPGGVPVSIVAADAAGNTLRQDLAPGFSCRPAPPPACTAGDTGFLSPAAHSADTGGDGNGFETTPANAYANGGGNARNQNGAGDRHRYFDYGLAVPAACAVKGVEVRLDWWLDSTSQVSSMGVQLSADGGATWTTVKTDTVESTSEHTTVLGSPTDTWGRAWTAADLANGSFRVRLVANSTHGNRDFFLDWVPVRVSYGAP